MCQCIQGLHAGLTTAEHPTFCLACEPGRTLEIARLGRRVRAFDKAVDQLDAGRMTPWKRTLKKQLRREALDHDRERIRLVAMNGGRARA